MTRLPTTLLTLMLTLALHGAAWAGPVAAGEADAASAASATTGAATPATAIGTIAPTTGPARGLGEPGRTADAASAPTGSALVLEMLKEADAGAAGHEAVRPPRRDAAGAASAAAPGERTHQPKRDDDPWGLRDIGKTALVWAKSAIPWLRSEDDETGKEVVLKPADWSASSLGHDGARSAGRTAEAGSHAQPEAEVIYGEAQRAQQANGENNLVREIIEVMRQVLEHPMTWLVVSLFVIGGIVVKRIDRRPTK